MCLYLVLALPCETKSSIFVQQQQKLHHAAPASTLVTLGQVQLHTDVVIVVFVELVSSGRASGQQRGTVADTLPLVAEW